MAHPSPPVPTGPSAPLANVDSGVRAARVVAALSGATGFVGALILLLHTDQGPNGERHPFVGQGVGLLAITLALTTLLLFLAGWAETWLADRVAVADPPPD